MKYLALSIPGYTINAPGQIPDSGLKGAGGQAINIGIQLLLILVSVFSLFYLLYGGYKWMTSGGDQEKLAGARMSIIYALLGLMVSFLSFAILKVLGTFFGVDLLTISFNTYFFPIDKRFKYSVA